MFSTDLAVQVRNPVEPASIVVCASSNVIAFSDRFGLTEGSTSAVESELGVS